MGILEFLVISASGLVLLTVIVLPILIIVLMFSNPGEKPPSPLDHRVAPCTACRQLVGIDDVYCPHCGARQS